MSSKIASKKRLEKHCDWAFDITTRFRASSDEESESESGPKLAATNTGTGGLLIDDLDLSKRGENVAYNPNPFSIAKINAAYRRQTTTVQSPIQPVRPSNNSPAATTTNAGDAGLLIDDLELSKREDNGAAYNSNPFSIAKTNAVHRRHTSIVDLIQPVRPLEQKPASSDTGAGGLLNDGLDLSGREDNGAYNPNFYSIAKINAAYRPQTTTVEPNLPMRISDKKPASTNIRAAGLLTDDLDLSEREDNSAYNPNSYSIANINASYPQTTTVNDSVVQANQTAKLAKKPTQTRRLTKRSRTNSNQTTIMEGFKTQAMKKSRIDNALQPPVPSLLPTSNLNPISSNSNLAVNKSPARLSQALKKPRINNALQLPFPSLLPTNNLSPTSSSSNLPVYKSPASLSPSASLISSPSPNPSNHLAKMRIPDDSPSSFMQVKSNPKRDAYQYSTKDLDEEWTTLPSKKRRRKPKFFLLFFLIFRLVLTFFLDQGIRLSPSRFIYPASVYQRQ